VITINNFPKCSKCDKGIMLPVEDVNQNGNVSYLKGWVCNDCGNNILFKQGDLVKLNIKDNKER